MTAKLRVTLGAALYVASPACDARTVHVPDVNNVTDVPAIEQTAGVVEVNATGSPDDAVAATVTGDCNSVWLGNGPNVIFCAILAAGGTTANDCCTCGAAV